MTKHCPTPLSMLSQRTPFPTSVVLPLVATCENTKICHVTPSPPPQTQNANTMHILPGADYASFWWSFTRMQPKVTQPERCGKNMMAAQWECGGWWEYDTTNYTSSVSYHFFFGLACKLVIFVRDPFVGKYIHFCGKFLEGKFICM